MSTIGDTSAAESLVQAQASSGGTGAKTAPATSTPQQELQQMLETALRERADFEARALALSQENSAVRQVLLEAQDRNRQLEVERETLTEQLSQSQWELKQTELKLHATKRRLGKLEIAFEAQSYSVGSPQQQPASPTFASPVSSIGIASPRHHTPLRRPASMAVMRRHSSVASPGYSPRPRATPASAVMRERSTEPIEIVLQKAFKGQKVAAAAREQRMQQLLASLLQQMQHLSSQLRDEVAVAMQLREQNQALAARYASTATWLCRRLLSVPQLPAMFAPSAQTNLGEFTSPISDFRVSSVAAEGDDDETDSSLRAFCFDTTLPGGGGEGGEEAGETQADAPLLTPATLPTDLSPMHGAVSEGDSSFRGLSDADPVKLDFSRSRDTTPARSVLLSSSVMRTLPHDSTLQESHQSNLNAALATLSPGMRSLSQRGIGLFTDEEGEEKGGAVDSESKAAGAAGEQGEDGRGRSGSRSSQGMAAIDAGAGAGVGAGAEVSAAAAARSLLPAVERLQEVLGSQSSAAPIAFRSGGGSVDSRVVDMFNAVRRLNAAVEATADSPKDVAMSLGRKSKLDDSTTHTAPFMKPPRAPRRARAAVEDATSEVFFESAMGMLWSQWFRVVQVLAVLVGEAASSSLHGRVAVESPNTWQPDAVASQCNLCGRGFRMFDRHHCRLCGLVHCSACSAMKVDLAAMGLGRAQVSTDSRGGAGVIRILEGETTPQAQAPVAGKKSRVCYTCFAIVKCLPGHQ